LAGLLLASSGCSSSTSSATPRAAPAGPTGDQAYLSVAHGTDPAAMTKTAVAALGGMERFVKPGQQVIIKPNICIDYYSPEYAVTTNPVVVGTLVSLCLAAGAKSVRVMDHPLAGNTQSAYAISGIEDAVKSAGGAMEIMSSFKFLKTSIPKAKDITSWEIYQDAIDVDVLIDVPIAKQHSLARLTLGGKNLMGLVANANLFHENLGQRVADLISVIQPNLTVVDAVRILVDHGPTGGSLNDVKQTNTVIASHDVVAADSFAASLFGLTGADIPSVKLAADMGLGILDLDSVKVDQING
jgi:uncharacterized protein (DUF362 family)